MNEIQVIKKAIERYGTDQQLLQYYEEVGEFNAAINHYRRGKCDKQRVIEEYGDVLLMQKQIQIMFGISDDELQNALTQSIKGLKGYLQKKQVMNDE